MTYQEAKLLLAHPAASLLGKQQAAFILSFLHAAFKQTGLTQVQDEVLKARLSAWLEDRRGEENFEWDRSARDYLEEWCSERCGWLRRTMPPISEVPVFELTSASEKALAWLESLRGSSFVGTESRMESIFHQMDELLRESSPDVESRIKSLRGREMALRSEIEHAETTGQVTTLEDWQIHERFQRLIEESRTLLSDFRQVEENFREVARTIVEQQSEENQTKGKIVGGVLDSHDSLRHSPQGKSFYGFVRLLLDPERRERFEDQAAKIQQLPHLDQTERDNTLLLRLLSSLRIEQEKVGESTQRLASNLRRALETSAFAERRRVREIISQVQQLALRARDQAPPRGHFFEVEELPRIWAGMSRPLWEVPVELKSASSLTQDIPEIDAETLGRMLQLAHLSIEELILRIDTCLGQDAWISIANVLRRYPPQHGLLEVIGYLVIAARFPERHHLPQQQTESLALPDGSTWRIPHVIFGRATEILMP